MDDTSLRAAGADEGGENQGQSAQVPAASGQDTVVTVIHDDEETGERGKDQAQHKRIMPMKRPNLDVRAEFDLETKGEGKTEVKCAQTRQGYCSDGQNCEHLQTATAFLLNTPTCSFTRPCPLCHVQDEVPPRQPHCEPF